MVKLQRIRRNERRGAKETLQFASTVASTVSGTFFPQGKAAASTVSGTFFPQEKAAGFGHG
jgi:hypothetical protein